MFGPEVLEASRSLYKVDFEAFGYEDGVPRGVDSSDGYSDSAVAEIGRLIERSERIGDLSRRVVQLRLELKEEATASSTHLMRRVAWRAKRRVRERLGLDERRQPT